MLLSKMELSRSDSHPEMDQDVTSTVLPVDNTKNEQKQVNTVLEKVMRALLVAFNFTGLSTMTFGPNLQRRFKSPMLIYCLILFAFHLLTIGTEGYVIMDVVNSNQNKTSIGRQVILRINYIQKSIHHIMIFIFLERSYKNLVPLLKDWTLMENNHNNSYGYDVRWKRRLLVTFGILLSLRLFAWPLGHIFKSAFGGINRSFGEYLHAYITKSRRGMYLLFGSSKVASAFTLIMANLSTLDWEVLSLYFLVVINTIRARWRIMHKTLLFKVKSNLEEVDWEVARNDYVQLVNCTNKVDDAFSPMILVYVITGVYWLLVRLHLGITGKTYQIIYRSFYFCHIAGLLIAVILAAASIIDDVEKISEIMDDLHAVNYGEKAGRFEERCRQPIRGITGCRFIYLNRSLVNMIIGILFTYEVVLLEMA